MLPPLWSSPFPALSRFAVSNLLLSTSHHLPSGNVQLSTNPPLNIPFLPPPLFFPSTPQAAPEASLRPCADFIPAHSPIIQATERARPPPPPPFFFFLYRALSPDFSKPASHLDIKPVLPAKLCIWFFSPSAPCSFFPLGYFSPGASPFSVRPPGFLFCQVSYPPKKLFETAIWFEVGGAPSQ